MPQATPASGSPTILLLMGAPGSGKGTQGRLLARHFNMPYLASGDLLRLAIEEQSEQGRRVQAYVERGLYVPDELMVPMVMAELERHYRGRTRGVILDGFPRTREQAVALDEALAPPGPRSSASSSSTSPRTSSSPAWPPATPAATAAPPTTCSPSPPPAAGSATSAGTPSTSAWTTSRTRSSAGSA